jgi:hypothetical protein
MPVSEVLELEERLEERLGRGADLLIVNALYPPLPEGRIEDSSDELFELWRRRRELNEAQLARLTTAWSGARVELPLLPLERGPRLVAELAFRLGGRRMGRGEGWGGDAPEGER